MYYQLQQHATSLDWTFYLPFCLMILMICMAVPVWVSIGLGTVGILYFTEVLPVHLIGESVFDGIDKFTLIAIPLFILTGDLLVRSKLSDKLLDFAEASVGGFRSGMGSSTVLSCGFFACVSGSDAAGAAAVSRMTVHRLKERGYPVSVASALVAAGACTGILIPPSIAYIIMGLVLGVSASTLFLAAMIPGVIILIGIMVTNAVMNRIHGYEGNQQRFTFERWFAAMWDARYALLVPIIILGGIYSGAFTPTEAAAVAATVTLIIGMIQKRILLADFPKILVTSAKINGIILPIIAMATPFSEVLAALNIPQSFASSISTMTDNPTIIILLIIGILVIAGCVMETTPNIVILGPILQPLALEAGMDQVQFCIMMVTALGVGFITPPLGLNLFVVSSITRAPLLSVAAKAVPFVMTMIMITLVIAFVPELSLWWKD